MPPEPFSAPPGAAKPRYSFVLRPIDETAFPAVCTGEDLALDGTGLTTRLRPPGQAASSNL